MDQITQIPHTSGSQGPGKMLRTGAKGASVIILTFLTGEAIRFLPYLISRNEEVIPSPTEPTRWLGPMRTYKRLAEAPHGFVVPFCFFNEQT